MKLIHGASLALLLLFAPALVRADDGAPRPAPPRNPTPATGQTPTTGQTGSTPAEDDDLLAPPSLAPQSGTPPKAPTAPSTGQTNTAPTTPSTGQTGVAPTTPTSPATGQTGATPRTGQTGQTGQPGTAVDEPDSDILDPLGNSPPPPSTGAVDGPGALDAVPQGQGPPPPPKDPAERARIDAAIKDEVARRAEAYGQEAARVNGLDPKAPGTAAEVERFNREASDRFDEVEAEFEREGGVSEEVESVAGGNPTPRTGDPSRPRPTNRPSTSGDQPVSSGDPSVDDWSDLGRPISSGSSMGGGGNPAGARRMNFWEKLVLAIMEGIHAGVKAGIAKQADELKLRSDKIAATTTPEYRAYVDYESRRAIEASAFGRAGTSASTASSAGGHDRRLDDLILGNTRAPVTPTSSSGSVVNTNTAATGAPLRISRLPRVRDPLTGEERVMIDMPLGVDPVRPLR